MRPCTSRCTCKHAGWKEACDYDKPRCLPRSSPRLWERMGRNAKETRRSQAYSSKVGGEGVGVGEGMEAWSEGGGGGLDALPYAHPPSLQRPHVCQPSTGASLLPILPILVGPPDVSQSPFSSFLSLSFSIVLIFKSFYYSVALIKSSFCS